MDKISQRISKLQIGGILFAGALLEIPLQQRWSQITPEFNIPQISTQASPARNLLLPLGDPFDLG